MARHALVIGIEQYVNPQQLPPLSKAVADAEAIAHILEKYGDCPRNQITLLTEKTTATGKVTTEDLNTALYDFLAEKRGDRIIYFSGHGILSQRVRLNKTIESSGYLATYDCQLKKKDKKWTVEEGGLKLADLADLISESQVSSLIVIFDACHSGSLIEEVKKNFAKFSTQATYYVIAACQSWEESWSKKSDQYSQFTNALINALSEEEIEENNGVITIGHAFEQAEKAMKNLGSLSSNKGRQKPIYLGMGSSLEMVKYHPTAQSLKPNQPSSDQISLEQITILKQTLQQINKPEILAWSLRESISYVALENWLDDDKSMGLDSFLRTIQNKFPLLEDQSLSLFKVIKTLAHHPKITPEIKTRLKQWLQNFPNLIIEQESMSDDQISAYLMAVVAQPRESEPFDLTAFWQLPNKPSIPIKLRNIDESKPYNQHPIQHYLCRCENWQDIQVWLKDIIEQTENLYLKGCPCTYKLNVELFLPFTYLTKDVDLWDIRELGPYKYKLGQEYRFLVRSWERISDGYYGNKLQEMWAYIPSSQNICLLDKIRRLDNEQNYNYKNLKQDLIEQQMIGLTCNLPENYLDVLAVLLDTGIPLALWSRPRPEDCQCQFNQLLNNQIIEEENQIKTAEDLMEAVYKKRDEDNLHLPDAKSKWSYYLAMLLDNPNRTPPSNLPLQTPGT